MFSLGLEFRLNKVGQIAATSGLAALLETSTMMGLGYLAGYLLGFTILESVFTGAIVAISSTTIIARAFDEFNVQGKLREVVFGILIIEDLIAIIMIALLTAIATGAGLSAWSLTLTVVRLISFLGGIVVLGVLIVPRFVRGVVKLERLDVTLIGAIRL